MREGLTAIRVALTRWLFGLLVAVSVLAIPLLLRPSPASGSVRASCAVGFDALARGELMEARRAFVAPTVEDAECAAAGLSIVAAREQQAKLALEECKSTKTAAEDLTGSKRKEKLTAASSKCLEALLLDPQLEETRSTFAAIEVDLAEASASETPTVVDDLEEASNAAWDVLERLGALLAVALVVIAIGLPLLGAAQLVVGRSGRTWLRGTRDILRRNRWARTLGQLLLLVVLFGALVGSRDLPWWAFGALIAFGVGGLVVALWAIAKSPRENWAEVIIVLAILVLEVVVTLNREDEFSTPVAVTATAICFIILAWVRAQTSSIGIGPFGDTTGKTDPPSPFGPLVVAEVVRLARPGRAGIDVVDSPVATGELDADSLNALVGAESKLAGALAKILKVLVRPGEYVITGQLIEEAAGGAAVTMQFKRGGRLLSAVTIFSRDFEPVPAEGDGRKDGAGSAPMPKEPAEGDAKADGDTTMDGGKGSLKHPDLAGAAAAWVVVRFLEELSGGSSGTVQRALEGARRWESVAYQLMAMRAFAGGDLEQAKVLYARAVDADSGNMPARLGLAQAGIRAPKEGTKFEIDALKRTADDSIEILAKVGDSPSLALRSAYLHVAALANLRQLLDRSEEKETLRERIVRMIGADAPPDSREALVWNVLRSVAGDAPPSEAGLTLDQLRMKTWSALAPIFLEFQEKDDESLKRRARMTLRGTYNLAAYYASRPHLDREMRREALDLLARAAAVPEYAAFARTDPYFITLKGDPEFEAIVGKTTRAGDDAPLSTVLVIGQHFAELLAKTEFKTLVQSRRLNLPNSSMRSRARSRRMWQGPGNTPPISRLFRVLAFVG